MTLYETNTVTGLPSTGASATNDIQYIVGGITLDVTAIAAVTADVTLPDGDIIRTGRKYIPFGAILVENGARKWVVWDGVAALVRDKVVINNHTITDEDPRFGQAPGAANGGTFYSGRLKVFSGGAWVAASAGQLTALSTAMPQLALKRMI